MKISDFKPHKSLYLSVASNAKIEDRVYVIADQTSLRINDEVCIRFASTSMKKKPNNILLTVDNLFTGPFIISPIEISRYGASSSLRMVGVFPYSQLVKVAVCPIPDWAMNDMFLSGKIGPDGYIKEGTEICAVTYGGHCTVVLKGGDIYNKIKSP